VREKNSVENGGSLLSKTLWSFTGAVGYFCVPFMKADRHGFSLVEVLVVSVVLGILGLGIANLMDQGLKTTMVIDGRSDASDHIRRMKDYLSSAANCNAVLAGRVFDPTPATLAAAEIPNSVSPAGLVIQETSPPNRVLASDAQAISPKLKLTTLKLKGFTRVGPGRYLADMEFDFRAGTSPLPTVRKLPLTLTTASVNATTERIDGCSSSGAGSSSASGQWNGPDVFTNGAVSSFGNSISLTTKGGTVFVTASVMFSHNANCDVLVMALRQDGDPWLEGPFGGNCTEPPDTKYNLTMTMLFNPPAGTHVYELGGRAYKYPAGAGSITLWYRNLTAFELP